MRCNERKFRMVWGNFQQYLLFYYIIMLNKLGKWFEINCGWFFINGRNQAYWAEYLRKKYGEK